MSKPKSKWFEVHGYATKQAFMAGRRSAKPNRAKVRNGGEKNCLQIQPSFVD